MTEEVQFHFLKSPDLKETVVDGVWGGIAVTGRIAAAVYTERPPIPLTITHSIVDGQLGPELLNKREAKTGSIRTIQSVLLFELESAKAFHQWLGDKIKELETARDVVK